MSFASDFNLIASIFDGVLDDRNAFGADTLSKLSGAFVRIRELIMEFGDDITDSELLEDVILFIT